MKLSVQWLRELVDLPEDLDELTERMTLLGLEVEAVTPVRLTYPGVVVGKVLEATPHPNADRLRVCTVHDGSQELQIVCGAPNVRAGIDVALATVGAVLPGDFKIKKSKIRGEVSLGMICSERELGLGRMHDGILELGDAPEAGTPLDEVFGYEDTCIEIEVTPNRPDWLSHLGVARELAAHYRTEVRWPEVAAPVDWAESDGEWSAEVRDPAGCRRFLGRRIDGVTVGQSPLWMRQRLIALGQRPINSIVDASNYVLHETGQPNHVFDRAKLAGSTIVLRRAEAGEVLTTLDDEERTLDAEHLVVADAGKAVAVAGIMGGANSEVEADSSEVLLEVAHFHPQVVRRGRRALALSTDASYRFERGIDHELMPWVVQRLTHLILASSGGTAHAVGFEAQGEPRPEPARFTVRASQVRRVVGVEIPHTDMLGYLQRLQVPVEADGEDLLVTQPSFRHDLLEEIDAVEEIARLHGYDALPLPDRPPMLRPAERTRDELLRRRLRETLAARGYHEVVATSFQSDGDLDLLGLAGDDPRRDTLAVLNPVVKEQASLRSTALPEMLRIVDRNRRRGHQGPIRLFQVDRCFRRDAGGPLATESETLTLVWNGPAVPLHFQAPDAETSPYQVVGEVEALLDSLGIATRREAAEGEAYHRPGSGLRVTASELRVAGVGELHGRVADAFGVEGVVWVAELDLAVLDQALPGVEPYRPFSVYPPSRRDLSLVVPRTVAYAAVVETMHEVLDPLLESEAVFDLYEGEGIPADSRAVGVRLSLRSPSGTLKDSRVEALLAKLLDELERRHAIRLR